MEMSVFPTTYLLLGWGFLFNSPTKKNKLPLPFDSCSETYLEVELMDLLGAPFKETRDDLMHNRLLSRLPKEG
jgi:hypothetical protein